MIFFFNLEPTNIVRKDSRIFWNLAFFFRATNKKTRFFFGDWEKKKSNTSKSCLHEAKKERGNFAAILLLERLNEESKGRHFFKSVREREVIRHFSRQAKEERGKFSRHFFWTQDWMKKAKADIFQECDRERSHRAFFETSEEREGKF